MYRDIAYTVYLLDVLEESRTAVIVGLFIIARGLRRVFLGGGGGVGWGGSWGGGAKSCFFTNLGGDFGVFGAPHAPPGGRAGSENDTLLPLTMTRDRPILGGQRISSGSLGSGRIKNKKKKNP